MGKRQTVNRTVRPYTVSKFASAGVVNGLRRKRA
jgi:hypothetical protein